MVRKFQYKNEKSKKYMILLYRQEVYMFYKLKINLDLGKFNLGLTWYLNNSCLYQRLYKLRLFPIYIYILCWYITEQK